ALLGGTGGCLLQLRGRLVEVLLRGGSGLLLRGRELLLRLVATCRELDVEIGARLLGLGGEARGLRIRLVGETGPVRFLLGGEFGTDAGRLTVGIGAQLAGLGGGRVPQLRDLLLRLGTAGGELCFERLAGSGELGGPAVAAGGLLGLPRGARRSEFGLLGGATLGELGGERLACVAQFGVEHLAGVRELAVVALPSRRELG